MSDVVEHLLQRYPPTPQKKRYCKMCFVADISHRPPATRYCVDCKLIRENERKRRSLARLEARKARDKKMKGAITYYDPDDLTELSTYQCTECGNFLPQGNWTAKPKICKDCKQQFRMNL